MVPSEGTCVRGGKVGAKTIGYEASHLTVEQYQNFQSEIKAELVPADGIIGGVPLHQEAGRD